MIKGCTKRVVVVKDVQSDIFEEAYLIMRPKSEKSKGHKGQNDILSEANRIVLDKSSSENRTSVTFEKKRRGKITVRDMAFFFAGALAGLGCFAVMFI